ncbi:type III secretion system translocon protein SseD [Yersinia intermedia]|uniref:chemotaxis protein n=1 Tax=Yersinia intermedia TaxID=631 RepID=UPI0005E3ADA7|nr:chemotaxis protein [Yersinia intermedia]CNI03169.1 methyl-accepting chemotaxis protein [Yersinia intermedia]
MNIPISQDIKVNDKALQTVDDGGKLDNSIGNIISDIADIISQMYALFKKMRDLLSAYGGKQFELLFNIKAAAMKNQREAIDKTASAAIASGVCSILSGVVSAAGAGAGDRLGGIGGHIGSVTGQFITGSGKLAEGDIARRAETSRMESNLQSLSSDSYSKNINEIQDKVGEARQGFKDFSNTLTNVINQISMAVKL